MEDASGIALSISGGGHRAAAFGLGTIAMLQELELMERAVVLSTVSGGSLVGSFYLAAKARAIAAAEPSDAAIAAALQQWHTSTFGQTFYEPFRAFLHSRALAEQLVRQLLPIGNRTKLINSAADQVNALLERHHLPVRLGDPALRRLLGSHQVRPDHVFFNATDLTSLDLFRFGVTRAVDPERGGFLPDHGNHGCFVVNNVSIPVVPQDGDADAALASDLAAGLRLADCVAASFCFPGGFEPLVFPGDFLAPASDDSQRRQRRRIVRQLCNGQRAVALMDGGLYDNLGLSSVEATIRAIRRQEAQALQIAPLDADPRRGRIYVIATDVDNIQPANKSLDPRSQQPQPPQPPLGPPGPGPLDWLKALPSGWGLLLSPLLLAAGLAGLPLLLLLWLTARLPILRAPLLPWLQRSPRLGRPLLDLGIVLSPALIAAAAAPPTRPRQLVDGGRLWAGRRLAELMPAFNGYLKRTRNLTYQALDERYSRFAGGRPNTFLLRNLIFQLAPGRDCDPASGLRELTRPLQPYPPAPQELCFDPDHWIEPKLARIAPLLGLPERLPADVDPGRLAELRSDLALDAAVRCWNDIQEVIRNPAQAAGASGPALSQLQRVALAVQRAWGPQQGQPLQGTALLSRLCEMATNLPTTLWLEDFCVYTPNAYDPQGETRLQGGWFVEASLVPPDRQVLQLEPGLAVELAIAAGRLNTCFNLLEFSASSLWPPGPR
jgi:predicted acylesterase/phospholipase RssA